MPDNDGLLRTSVGTNWKPKEPPVVIQEVLLCINTPDPAKVRRNALTGQIEITGITINDLISLRDSISEQIIELQLHTGNGWEAL